MDRRLRPDIPIEHARTSGQQPERLIPPQPAIITRRLRPAMPVGTESVLDIASLALEDRREALFAADAAIKSLPDFQQPAEELGVGTVAKGVAHGRFVVRTPLATAPAHAIEKVQQYVDVLARGLGVNPRL